MLELIELLLSESLQGGLIDVEEVSKLLLIGSLVGTSERASAL